MRINKLSKIHNEIPSWMLAKIITKNRHDNYLAFSKDGFYTLHMTAKKALEAAVKCQCDRVVSLKE